MPISWFLALRFLREGRMQSVLIVAGVSVGVAVMVFLSALIDGLQSSLVAQTLGTQAHVVVRPPDEVARPLRRPEAGVAVAARVEQTAQRARSIVGWQQVVVTLAAMPGVTAVSPVVSGPAVALRGNATRAVVLYGVDPDRFARIYPVRQRMVAGRFDPTSTSCVIGRELAVDLGVVVGDRVRLAPVGGAGDVYLVAGVFDLGNREVNRRWVVVSMRGAQTMLDLVGGVSSVDLRVREIFAADAVAADVTARTGLVADSWMKTNAQLLVALRSQASSSQMIQFFVILAVAMGIASVLVVSVVQKGKEIGILRAMGTARGTVLRVFLLQGALVGLAGSVLGTALGAGLGAGFAAAARNADGSPTFPITVSLALVARSAGVAFLTGVLAATLPARRAARLDPAVAIRNG
ncbi:MAG: ABC transporter permease [Deltaproteobacteria bacterium]|nr:ABC transporter permease [Myxococcales bacterium]MDP3215307.1 ABC transporter permease [Deltaproteobacteria bacterium]